MGKFGKILHALTPPALAWRLRRTARERLELENFKAFYSGFLKPGDLCFDIGANLGNRVRSFRALGCKVLAVEPQARCIHELERNFRSDAEIIIVPKAAGKKIGKSTLRISSEHVLSSMSENFINRTRSSGRFDGVEWGSEESIEVTTLEQLIEEYGMPQFIKIDVEGHEPEVLDGLGSAVPALSFEWVPELFSHALACIERLEKLAHYEYNLSWGESMRFSRQEWRGADSMLQIIGEFQGENLLFGDIYARIKK